MRVTSFLLLATLFVITWEKVHWDVAGSVGLHDVLTILFLVAFALVYLLGFSTSERSRPSTSTRREW